MQRLWTVEMTDAERKRINIVIARFDGQKNLDYTGSLDALRPVELKIRTRSTHAGKYERVLLGLCKALRPIPEWWADSIDLIYCPAEVRAVSLAKVIEGLEKP